MLEGFEEAFVDVQSRVVSLCLELLKNSEKEADKIYIYLFQNDDEDYIDAFFEKEGNLYTGIEIHQLFSEEEIDDFFDCGVEDIENIIDICKAYDVKCPHEFRLTYNVISKSFDSNYNYDNVTEALDKDVLELVEDWFNECNKSISEQEKEIVFYNETKKKNEDARVFVITNFFKYVTD